MFIENKQIMERNTQKRKYNFGDWFGPILALFVQITGVWSDATTAAGSNLFVYNCCTQTISVFLRSLGLKFFIIFSVLSDVKCCICIIENPNHVREMLQFRKLHHYTSHQRHLSRVFVCDRAYEWGHEIYYSKLHRGGQIFFSTSTILR